MRPAVGFGNPEVAEKECDGFGFHGRAAIGMKGQLAGIDALLAAGFIDQTLGQRGRLTVRNHPPDDVSAEDVQDYIEIEVAPLLRAEKLRDVPRPDPIRSGGEEFGF